MPPRRLDVDETTLRRPRRFMTGIVDLETSRLWDIFEGRSKAALANRLRLEAALDADDTLDLKSVWILKEALRDVYDSTGRRQAERELADWHRWAAVYDVEETNRLAKTLRQWGTEILAYFDTGLTNGATEGRNLIVKQVKRQGFGYTNPHNYRLRVLYRCA